MLATATQVNLSKLADGISHALVVTLFGVGDFGARDLLQRASTATGLPACAWTSATSPTTSSRQMRTTTLEEDANRDGAGRTE